MDLVLKRKYYYEDCTIGELYVDKTFQCFVLEDTEREGQPKIPGKTAIPRGKYEVCLDFSNRFKRILPHILKVPNFEGIRIHAGNCSKDTEGCLLTGTKMGDSVVYQSRIALEDLMDRLYDAYFANEPISIEIIQEL